MYDDHPLDQNPFIKPYNHFEAYNEQIKKLKDNPELLSFSKLCFELFESNETGRKFMEYIENTYLIPGLAKRGAPTYQIDAIWAEGFKDGFRLLKQSIHFHKQYIQAGKQSETVTNDR